MQPIKALFFDVFGTLVDWRGSVVRQARELLAPLGVAIDWEAFADAWHSHYRPAMDEVRSGGSYFSQSDLRVHFGLGKAETADIEIHWPSGTIDKLEGVKANRVIAVKEGSAPRK